MKKSQNLHRHFQRSPLAAAVVFGLLVAPMAQAFEFERGEIKGSFDSTVTYGITVRAEDPSENVFGKGTYDPLAPKYNYFLPGALAGYNQGAGFGGSAEQAALPGKFGINGDDGDYKYQQGDIISNTFKINSELELSWRSWGLFTRALYFYDFENAGRDDMSEAALNKVGTDFRLYDAFIWKNYSLGANDEVAGSIRFGKQVVSWGESTFIQNGINIINPVDVSRLRIAGAELKEAFLPTNMIWGSTRFSESVSMEAYYQLNWRPVEVDPSGTYFSTNDYASPGGRYLMLSGAASSPVLNPELYDSTCVAGGGTNQPNIKNSDKYEDYVNLYGHTSATNPWGAETILTAACAGSVARIEDRKARDSGQFGLAVRWYAEALHQTEFGFYAMNYHSRVPLLSGRAVTKLLPSPIAGSAGLIVEYPEDIHLFGISFNTTIPGGVAWQGELSYRPNAPFQIDDTEVLNAALSPINQVLRASTTPIPPAMFFPSQLGEFSSGQYVKGWREYDMTQLQMTFTKAFGNILGAESLALVGEIGATEVGLPNADELRFEVEGSTGRPGCSTGDAQALIGSTFQLSDQAALFGLPAGCLRNSTSANPDAFATSFSWGYRLLARAEFNNVFGSPINLAPRIAFSHDVQGNSPGPGGNFLEGRQSMNLAVEANYLNKVLFELGYAAFWGAENQNQLQDRDLYSFSVKYSF